MKINLQTYLPAALAVALALAPTMAVAQFGGGGNGQPTAPGTLTKPTGSGTTPGRDILAEQAVQSRGYMIDMQTGRVIPRPEDPPKTRH
jgi:hypothetical protein